MRPLKLILLPTLLSLILVGCNEFSETPNVKKEPTECAIFEETDSEIYYECRTALETFTFKLPKARDGKDGKDGAAGEKGETGATGAQGPTGEIGPRGEKGDSGADGISAIYEIIDPCGDSEGYDEILLRLNDGQLMAYFENGNNRFLSLLPPGLYITTDSQKCLFKVNDDLTVTW